MAVDQDAKDYQDYQDYQAYQAQSDPGFMNSYVKPALGLIGAAANKVDSYTGAPTRAAIGAAENAPSISAAPGAALSAGLKQFGADPSTAPSGKQLLSGAGMNLPEKAIPPISPLLAGLNYAGYHPTYNDVAGAGVEMAANPLNALPGIPEAKAVGEGAEAAETAASGTNPLGRAISKYAEKKAVESTGATGNQVYRTFKPGSGRALLDQGIVKFGNSQAAISAKADEALEATGQTIGDTLERLSSKGATVDQADVITAMRKRAQQLGENPAQFNVADQLNRTADRMQSVIESKGGNSEIPLNLAEGTKREFQGQSNYIGGSATDISHSKEMAAIYQKAVEDSATKFDPESAKAFEAAKKQYSVLKPIADAAGKRAATTAQSPKGGMLDTLATGVGSAVGGTPGALIAVPARRMLADRIMPSIAGAANTMAKGVNAAPGLLKPLTPISQGLIQARPAMNGLLNAQ